MPQEPTVLLKESLERATSRAAIEPDNNFLWGLGLCGGEEPEEELSRLIWVVRDGQQTSVTLANVERNFWNSSTVDGKGYQLISRALVVYWIDTYTRSC